MAVSTDPIFRLDGFEQSHIEHPGIDPNYGNCYNGPYWLAEGKTVSGRPVYENHNPTPSFPHRFTHRYVAFYDGYWRGVCAKDDGGGSDHNPWDKDSSWAGQCDMMVCSDVLDLAELPSGSEWMVYTGFHCSANPKDFVPVKAARMTVEHTLAITCELREGGTSAGVTCTDLGGNVVGDFVVPPNQDPLGDWLLKAVCESVDMKVYTQVRLVDTSGKILHPR